MCARTLRDINNLIKAADLKVALHRWPNADYRFRILVEDNSVAKIFECLARSIDYPNFKNRIHDLPDPRAKLTAYTSFWHEMSSIQKGAMDSKFRRVLRKPGGTIESKDQFEVISEIEIAKPIRRQLNVIFRKSFAEGILHFQNMKTRSKSGPPTGSIPIKLHPTESNSIQPRAVPHRYNISTYQDSLIYWFLYGTVLAN